MAILLSIFGFLKNILGDWRVLLLVVMLCAGGYAYYKYSSVQEELKKAQETLVIEQKNNETLRGNVSTLQAANVENQRVIDQVTADRARALQSIAKLNNNINVTSQSIADLHAKVNQLTVPPTPLTPFLRETIKGIEDQRDIYYGIPARPVKPAQPAVGGVK